MTTTRPAGLVSRRRPSDGRAIMTASPFAPVAPVLVAPPAAPPERAVRRWLFGIALLVFAMVMVGGATRLTESGLSITEWQPLLGALPPLTDADWQAAFAKYREIPQYRLLNAGMTLGEFKAIYWWEWAHRLLGRLVGVAFAVPFVLFWLKGRLARADLPALAGLFVLGGLQGAIGWWMVASGLSERTSVAPYRLAVHLTLACIILAGALALAARPAAREVLGTGARRRAAAIVALVLAQIFLGALVAGNDAGLVYNTWPLMDGRILPAEAFDLVPWWRNLFENHALVQFVHRGGAYVLFVLVVWHGFSVCAAGRCDAVRASALLLVLAVTAQAGLGIATLVTQVPMALALAHQAMAVAVLTLAVVHRGHIA
jgi:cytochrome c oxidase assembly protein subunit 15